MSMSHWAATVSRNCAGSAISLSSGRSLASGTVRTGRSFCWGLFYFVLLLVEKLTHFPEKIGPLAHAYALLAIMCGWTLFHSKDLASAWQYLAAMFGQAPAGLIDATFWIYLTGSVSVLVLGCLLSAPVWPAVQQRFAQGSIFQYGEPIWAAGVFLLATLVCISASYNPFIYFNF